MTFIAMLFSKILLKIMRMFSFGATTLPGRAAIFFKYNILSKLSRGVKIICVTGTNGKTTVCALIEQGLKSSGKSYFINRSGANMLSGITTAFVENSSVFGKCKKEYAVIECDENSLETAARYIDAEIIVVTNIFRDQLDRYGEVSYTLSKIISGIKLMPDAVLCLNADCPLTYSIKLKCKNKAVLFGVNANFNSTAPSDIRYCPVCSTQLEYSRKVYAQLGDYRCRQCGFKRETPNLEVDNITTLSDCGSEFTINSRFIKLSLGGIYNIYNFCAAACALIQLGTDNISPLCSYSGAFGRTEKFTYNGRSITILLVKNPVGMTNCVEYVSKMNDAYSIAFAINDNPADGTDVSWLWDVSYRKLSKFKTFYTVGIRSADMAVRLKYDDIACTVIKGENYKKLIDIFKQSDSNFAVFSTYTSMMNMREILIRNFGGKEFALIQLGTDNISPLCSYSGAFGRTEKFTYNGRSITILLVKNPVGMTNCVEYVSKMNDAYSIAFAINDNPADGTDVSWLWDVSFRQLSKFKNFYTVGIRSADMAVRLKYDDIACTVIKGENYKKLIDIFKQSDSNFAVFSTYTSMMNMREILIRNFGGKEFWQ